MAEIPQELNGRESLKWLKVMLEKNFVATLTNALAEVDPNFPDIRGVVTGILRPLEYLYVHMPRARRLVAN